MTTILATLALLGVLILVHELGHFWAARAVGIGVERFSIGLGPRVWGFERGGTEYVVSAIPLGGYVKMQGMADEIMEHVEGGAAAAADDREAGGSGAAGRAGARGRAGKGRTPGATAGPGGERRSSGRGAAGRGGGAASGARNRAADFESKSIAARAFVISAGVAMNMVFAFVVYTAVAAVWGYQDLTTTRVMAVDESLLPPGAEALADLSPGAEVVRVGDLSPSSWGDVRRGFIEGAAGEMTIETRSPDQTFRIAVSADPGERLALAGALQYWVDPVVGRVTPDLPAEAASLEAGDRIVSVAGVPVTSWAEMVREIRARPGERVELGVMRGDAALMRRVELDSVTIDGEERGRLGVLQGPPETVTVPVGAGEALATGWRETIAITARILGFLGDLVSLDVSPREVGSIGTIAVASGEAASQGAPVFLRFMALFSVNLAILNLLPIPLLDGGHLVFLGIELVRGRKLSVKQRIRWSKVGYLVVLGIMVWALGNDLLRFLGL